MRLAALLTVALFACSNDDEVEEKQKHCDDIAADIRDKAQTQYNQPAQGACNNPALKPMFDRACELHAQCERELAELKK